MLSDREKQEMLEDARSESRRKAFAQAKERSLVPMSGPEFLEFLNNNQKLFLQQSSPHKIMGNNFKL